MTKRVIVPTMQTNERKPLTFSGKMRKNTFHRPRTWEALTDAVTPEIRQERRHLMSFLRAKSIYWRKMSDAATDPVQFLSTKVTARHYDRLYVNLFKMREAAFAFTLIDSEGREGQLIRMLDSRTILGTFSGNERHCAFEDVEFKHWGKRPKQ